jgi:hypothetical protein
MGNMNRVHHTEKTGEGGGLFVWLVAGSLVTLTVISVYFVMSTPSTHTAALLP